MRFGSHQERYDRWWLGKKCRVNDARDFKLVTKVKLHGPPSFVYGSVELYFEDGTSEFVSHGMAFRPRKSDVEVLTETK